MNASYQLRHKTIAIIATLILHVLLILFLFWYSIDVYFGSPDGSFDAPVSFAGNPQSQGNTTGGIIDSGDDTEDEDGSEPEPQTPTQKTENVDSTPHEPLQTSFDTPPAYDRPLDVPPQRTTTPEASGQKTDAPRRRRRRRRRASGTRLTGQQLLSAFNQSYAREQENRSRLAHTHTQPSLPYHVKEQLDAFAWERFGKKVHQALKVASIKTPPKYLHEHKGYQGYFTAVLTLNANDNTRKIELLNAPENHPEITDYLTAFLKNATLPRVPAMIKDIYEMTLNIVVDIKPGSGFARLQFRD